MFSRKFRYKKQDFGPLIIQTKSFWWPFWINVHGFCDWGYVLNWAVAPTSTWKYLDSKDMK